MSNELRSIEQASSNAVAVVRERDELAKSVSELQEQLDAAKRANAALQQSELRHWFMVGGGVLGGGILLGLLLPYLWGGNRRKNSIGFS